MDVTLLVVFHRWLIALLSLAGVVAVAAGVLLADGEGDGSADEPSPVDAPAAAEPPEAGAEPGRPRSRPSREGRERPRGALGRIEWRDSRALGAHHDGRLVSGVLLPSQGATFFTWHPVKEHKPNPAWRRWGTDVLIRRTLRVLRGFARAHPNAPRIGIGDISREHGGNFGPEVSGGLGHVSHQNGLDVDVYYPLRSGRERAARRVSEIDTRLAQDLVDRFTAAGAVRVFVGPNTGLRGPRGVVVPLANHDDHLHARFAP
ncbi:MAG TPA: penicillin-insensitive murein endopeptidase [Solirubrobacterales bacterium]